MGKTKRCTKCGKRKSVNSFAHDRTKKDGIKTQCKECMNAADKERRERRKAEKEKEKALRIEASKKRLAESKKSFKNALAEEVANRKMPKKVETDSLIWLMEMIKDVVNAISDKFGLETYGVIQFKLKK